MSNTNTVELLGWYGSDITHAQSAWTSTSRDLDSDKLTRVPALLKMLAEKGHHTVFEKSSLHFLVTTEVSSHIHLIKHRIGVSVNAESARYKELRDDKYYVPIDWPEEERAKYAAHLDDCLREYHETLERLVTVHGFSRKRAKESARFYIPYGNQLTADVMFNFRSFHHFLGLRMKPEAQLEISLLAEEMLSLVKGIEGNPFEHTLAAFGY